MLDENIEKLLLLYDDKKDEIEMLKEQVYNFFRLNKALNSGVPSVIHSIKARSKDRGVG